jgi:lipopolysaccharide biosynthesis glycosyltransferase
MINIAFVTDGKYAKFTLVTLKSIIENTSERLNVYILYSDIDPNMQDTYARLFDANKACITFIRYDIEKYKKYIIKNSNLSYAIFAKFDIPNLIDQDRVIYLDSDIVLTKDIKKLWDSFNYQYPLMAVANPAYSYWKDKEVLGLSHDEKTLNSGVLLLNNEVIRRDNDVPRLFEFMNQNHELLKLPDEAAFNSVFKNRWLELPPWFNLTTLFYRRNHRIIGMSKASYSEMMQKKTVIHFTGQDKPWSILSPHPDNWIWRKYYKSLFGPYRYADSSLQNILKKIGRKTKYLISFNK